MIIIDGSLLEGGGQILRVASSLSCILSQPIEIQKIRAGRSTPGLATQHQEGLHCLTQLTNGNIQGNSIGSSSVTIIPGLYLYNTCIQVSIQTAGAITLVLQSLLPCILLGKNQLQFHSFLIEFHGGGTNVSNSPPIEHFQYVLVFLLQRLCHVKINTIISRRGFFPRGGANMKVELILDDLNFNNGIQLTDRGELLKLSCYVCGYGCLIWNERELRDYIQQELKDIIDKEVEVYIDISLNNQSNSSNESNLAIQLCLETSTGCILSSNGSEFLRKSNKIIDSKGRSIKLIQEVLNDMKALISSNCCIDEYTADQLIIFMAMCPTNSHIIVEPENSKSSKHLETAIYIANLLTKSEFLPITTDCNQCRHIRCSGRVI